MQIAQDPLTGHNSHRDGLLHVPFYSGAPLHVPLCPGVENPDGFLQAMWTGQSFLLIRPIICLLKMRIQSARKSWKHTHTHFSHRPASAIPGETGMAAPPAPVSRTGPTDSPAVGVSISRLHHKPHFIQNLFVLHLFII